MITVDNMPPEMRRGHGPGWNKGVTHCRQGHEYTPENTLNKDCGRACRECARKAAKRWYREKGTDYHRAYRAAARERRA